LEARIEGEKLDQLLAGKTDPAAVQALRARREELARREAELRARMGDPLIQVERRGRRAGHRPSARRRNQAPLWNVDAKRWEARFDIPTYASEGTYHITVVIVGKDGTRRTLTLRYHVDVTPPTGRGSVQATAGDTSSLRLELDASEDTARVSALLPWGEQVALRPSPGQPNRFFARVTVPPNRAGQAHAVTFVLTDKAHNRTMVTVDLSE
jgi:hypothetical protein